MPRFATKPGSGLGLGGRSSTLKTAAAAVGFTLVVVRTEQRAAAKPWALRWRRRPCSTRHVLQVYMLQYVQVDVHQLAKKQTPS
jgi:hypothetical protein